MDRLSLKALARAMSSTANLVTVAAAATIAALLGNPLPLIIYGLIAVIWGLSISQSQVRRDAIAAEERAMLRTQVKQARQALRASIERAPKSQTIASAIDAYLREYDELQLLEQQIEALLLERKDLMASMVRQLEDQLDRVLRAYLNAVQARILHARLLSGLRRSDTPVDGDANPALATQLASSIEIEKQRAEALRECELRDERAAIQLGALPTTLQVLHTRLSLASELQMEVLMEDIAGFGESIVELEQIIAD